MTIDAHTLAEYLLGSLTAVETKAVEDALAASADLRRQLLEITEVFADVGAALTPMPPTPRLRDRVLASAAPRSRLADLVDVFARFVDLGREAATALLVSMDDASRWGASPWPGVGLFHIAPGPRLAGAEVGFIHMKPGTRFPWHGHDGDEQNLVLQGALQVSDGRVVEAGETYQGTSEIWHDFVALDGPDLILAAVLRGTLCFPDGSGYSDH